MERFAAARGVGRQAFQLRRRILVALAAAGVIATLAWGGSDDNSAALASTETATTFVHPDSDFTTAGFGCVPGSLRSSGSTAQGKAMAELIRTYNAGCATHLGDYGGGGSGKGITDFLTHQTDFAGSDTALVGAQAHQAREQRCEGNEVVNLPLVIGPIALAYHLPGVDRLILSPTVMADIFAGKLTRWDDPALAKLNPGISLPPLSITPVHRSEDSGTTDNFTQYLAAAGDWPFEPGKAWLAPGGIGAQGSDGVAKEVAATTGAIGYVELGFALQARLSTAELDNGAGPVALTAETATGAVTAAKIVGKKPDLTLHLDYAATRPNAYPLVMLTYQVVCSGGNEDQADLLRSFLGFAATEGQQQLARLGAAPLPTTLRDHVIETIRSIH